MLLLPLLSLLTTPAEAGCATDEDHDQRQAAAPLVVLGEVVSIEITETEDATIVFQRVAVTETFKGEVAQGGLLLRTGLPNRVDTSPTVFPVGTQVSVIGALDDEGAIPISPCTDDVRHALARGALKAVARKQRRSAQRFEGVSPTPPAVLAQPTLPEDGPRLSTRQDERWVDGQEVSRDGETLLGLFDLGTVEVLQEVPVASLRTVVREDVAVTDELWLYAGTPVDPEDWTRLWDHPTLLTPLLPAQVSDTWTPGRSHLGFGEGALFELSGDVLLFDAPGGDAVVTLNEDSWLYLSELGPATEAGWRLVHVYGPGMGGAGLGAGRPGHRAASDRREHRGHRRRRRLQHRPHHRVSAG